MDLSRIFKHSAPPHDISFLNDLGEAIIRVEEKYCKWPSQFENRKQYVERVFCQELYYQLRLLTSHRYDILGLRIDGETVKQINNSKSNNLGSIYRIKQITFSPDLVVHLGQVDANTVNQKLIAEVKTRKVPNPELGKTIIKLNHFISVLKFQYAALISVNTDFGTIKSQLQKIFPTNIDTHNRLKRIIVFNYNNRLLHAETLYSIILTRPINIS